VATSIVTVLDSINSLLVSPPFALTPALEPFSFELQPQQGLDASYCLTSELLETDGYFGYRQGEIHGVTLWLARTTARTPYSAVTALQTLCSSLCAAIARDGDGSVYHGWVTEWSVPEPGPDDDYVLARVDARVDFDREL
jgi:hypothetical protein